MYTRPAARALVALLGAWVACACGAARPEGQEGPLGPDVDQPFPIDRGDDGAHTPGSYKGLWLRLTDNGEPRVTSADGAIGLVCLGMSNARQECGDFASKRRGELAPQVNPEVVVVNCAVGGHAIEDWIDPGRDAELWDACRSRRLPAAGLRPEQVRVIYHKAANERTTLSGGEPRPLYPDPESDYFRFHAHLGAFAARVRHEFPAVQAVYTSSRSFGGFAGRANRGEPLSFEEGLALNAWLAEHPDVDGVWYGWGPYLWAPDCATGTTNAAGVCYVRSDYQADGVHPAQGALDKISWLIHARFRQQGWYLR